MTGFSCPYGSCGAAVFAVLISSGCQACNGDAVQLRRPAAAHPQPATSPRAALSAEAATLPQASTASAMAEPPPQVRISEVLFDPLLLDEGAGEYLELVNLSNRSVRLADLVVVLPTGRRVSPERPHLPWLRPGEVALARSAGRHPDLLVRGLRLPNTAGRVELWWREIPLDVAQWVVQRRRARPGVAWERRDPRTDGALAAAWRPATEKVHHVERGSPGIVEWPCPAIAATALARACPIGGDAQPVRGRKNAKGRNLCSSGPVVGRWGGT